VVLVFRIQNRIGTCALAIEHCQLKSKLTNFRPSRSREESTRFGVTLLFHFRNSYQLVSISTAWPCTFS
jgi:hypothetical protein